jgi:chorismate mutase/prephenate dehydrogenase
MSDKPRKTDPKTRLAELRDRISRLDEELLALVDRRLAAAAEGGEIKSAGELPIRNYTVEARVLERMRRGCEARSIDPELGQDLARLLIEHAVKLQSGYQDLSYKKGSGEVLVVGGLGKMGRWLCDYFHATGHRVRIFDPGAGESEFAIAPDLFVAAAAADLIVLAVPISVIPTLLAGFDAAAVKGLVLDVASLKTPLIAALREACGRGLRIASLHPMFGPEAVHLIGRNIVLCDCGDDGALGEARGYFEDVGANLIELSLEEHDRRIGYVLGLAHLVSILYAQTLASCEIDYGSLGDVASTTFAKQNATAMEVIAENPDLYFEIQSLNAQSPELDRQLRSALDELLRVVASGDRAGFHRIMESGRQFFLD